MNHLQFITIKPSLLTLLLRLQEQVHLLVLAHRLVQLGVVLLSLHALENHPVLFGNILP